MKGLRAGIITLLLSLQGVFGGTAITTNSFVRHDIGFSAAPMDFAVGAWNTNGDPMIAAVTLAFTSPATNTVRKLEVISIGANLETNSAFVVYAATNATGPISLGDIDGDGANDIVFGAGTNVVVRLNTSSATAPAFETAASFVVGGSTIPQGMAVVDLDGDGKLDVVYATDAIRVLRNQSTAGVVSFAAPVTINTNTATFDVADLDGDGRADLKVRPTADFSREEIVRNTSSAGAFSFVVTSMALSTQRFLLDVNGDSKADGVTLVNRVLRFPEEPLTSLRIATNSSTVGSVSFANAISVEIDAPPADLSSKIRRNAPAFRPDLAGGDFNQDGRVDLVWVNWTNQLVFLENLNLAPSSLTLWAQAAVVPALTYPYAPTVADMNRDGKPDLVVGAGRFVSIFENRIEPIPELVVNLPQSVVELGAMVNLRAAAYAADVTAVDFLEDGKAVASATALNGLRAQYQPSNAGLHTITARATVGANIGLASKAAGLRVQDSKVGRVVDFGSGVASSTTLLIYDSGRAFGVGSNVRGQLADSFYEAPHAGFVEIPAPANAGGWKAMSAGSAFTIGLTTTGRVFSWGANDVGQLGRPSNTSTDAAPAEVTFVAAGMIRKIGAGRDFAIALDENGELFAWGKSEFGQLGNGYLGQRNTPRRVKKPSEVNRWTDVSVGLSHALALDDAGRLFGWGWNFWGQVGQPRTNVAILEPILIELPPGETAWTKIFAGVAGSYATTASGQTYRWGNYLTDAGEMYEHVPALLDAPEGSAGFRMIGVGAPLNVGLGNDAQAYVWGGGVLAPTGLGGDELTVTNPTRLPLPAGVAYWTNLAVASR